MKKETIFLASQAVAEKCGVVETCYRTKDGKFILSEKNLKFYKTVMTPEEFIHGIDAQIITSEQAAELVKTSTLGKKTLELINKKA